jgi:hypothetical protein
MARVHAYIKESQKLYNNMTRYELLEHIATVSGTFWIEDDLEPWERMNDWPELELLSAFEFLRPELSGKERQILDGWIAKYTKWSEQGIFPQRYDDTVCRAKYSWEAERKDAETELGRSIPKSHWWFWPPSESD